ncbi:serine family amino acid catabolism-related protein [Diplodia corticola]|uniref:L-serine ammonia-lyase n=1 Tax=Diplodia corticola TaxID=236234 RepID=A0A1J9QUM5_9PEZI|nr:serine family amino acid catabolism-related protein [Diplodia corticola]OJD31674.1 serine family amino acid catabolism-related protein [Diplodia corticola]
MTVAESNELPTDRRPWRTTPLVESVALSNAAGCRVFLKLENLQPSGSFKSRGIGNLMTQALLRAGAGSGSAANVHFYSSSGGNAGLAAVHASAAGALGRPCTVVVPVSTPARMVAKLRAAGARDVVRAGATWAEADAHLRGVVMVEGGAGGVYVPPFDHVDVWEGNKGVVGEVVGQLRGMGMGMGGVEQEEGGGGGGGRPAAVVCSVGGGGLLNGVCMGVEEAGWAERGTKVVAVETEGAASLNESVRAGRLVTLPGITSLAMSLGATRVSEVAFANGLKDYVKSVVYSDGEAAMGCLKLADEERLLVELACGVSAAVCFGGRLEKAVGRKLRKEEAVVIVVCGGSHVTVEMLAEWRKKFEDVE